MTDAAKQVVLIMAGGTGGHVFPALAAAERLQAEGIHVEWLGTERGIESRLVPAANMTIHYLDVTGLRGKGLLSVLSGLVNLIKSLVKAVGVVKQLQPICVLGMGGYASGPGGIAAWLLRKPLVIHEQNSVAGTTNRLLSHFAQRVLQGYPLALGGNKARFIGNPVRAEIKALPTPELRGVATHVSLRLLVLGGSLGAKALNDCIPKAMVLMASEQRPEILHQTGETHVEAVKLAYQHEAVDARVEAFIEDMTQAYGWADIVICRAGALTVAELTAAGLASILVPLPHAIDDHQTANANWLAQQDAGLLMPQSTLTAELLAEKINHFNQHRDALMVMANNARALAKNDATEQVVANCLEVANV